MKGLSSKVAVERLVNECGRTCDQSTLLGLRKDWALEGVQRALHQHGLIVRPVTIDVDALQRMNLPTLVQTDDDRWVLIRSRRGSDLFVEGDTGSGIVSASEVIRGLNCVGLELTERITLPGNLWRALIPPVVRKARALSYIAFMALLVQLLSLAPALWTGIALDEALPQHARSLLLALALGLVLTGAFQAWVTWLRQRAVLMLRTELQVVMERGFLDHVLRLPFGLLYRQSAGSLMQAMSGLSDARTLLTDRAVGVLLDGALSAMYLVAMAAIVPAQAGVIAFATALFVIVAALTSYLQVDAGTSEVDAGIRQRTFILEALSGIATLKAMGAEGVTLDRWSSLVVSQLGASIRRQRLGLWIDVTLQGMRDVVMVVVLVWGGHAAASGAITLGTFVAFSQLSTGFVSTVVGLTTSIVGLRLLRPNMAKAYEIARLQARSAPRRPRGQRPVAVAVEGVWFRYQKGAPWILRSCDLRVEPGSRYQIKGPSGSGKSTLLRVIAGLHRPQRGRVRIGGNDVAASTGEVLYLPQFVSLYSGTILENLKMLSAYSPRERLFSAAEETGLDAYVRTLPMGYQTLVAHGGTTLSGGQAQLVAITGAIASEKQVLLLDEAAANLDSISQAWMNDGSRWFANRTVIYVSHEASV